VTPPGTGTPDTSVFGLLKFIVVARLPIWGDASLAVKGWSPCEATLRTAIAGWQAMALAKVRVVTVTSRKQRGGVNSSEQGLVV
jgi:hypothetical protein